MDTTKEIILWATWVTVFAGVLVFVYAATRRRWFDQ